MANDLDIDQVAPGETTPETTVNDAVGQVADAISSKLTTPIDATNADTLTNDEFRRYMTHELTNNGATGAVTLTVPSGISRGLFMVRNETGQSLTVTISAQTETAPTIANGSSELLWCDGSDVMSAAAEVVI